MVGLGKLDVVTIFKRHFEDQTITDSLVKSIAMAVGETIEENNRKIVKELREAQQNNHHKLGRVQ